MSILKIARMGHPVLRQRAEPVADPTDPDVARLLRDMIETLEDIGGAGLAAPQVHVPLRVIIFRVPAEARGITAVINPEIEPLGGETALGWEGCLSIPGLRGAVPRYQCIRYRGVTPLGERVEVEASGFHARVVQHECDHLDGVLYLDRMPDMRLLTFTEEGQRYPTDLATYLGESEADSES